MKRFGLTVAAMTAACFAALPVVAQVQVTLAISSEPSTLDPQKTFDGGERRITDNIYETLIERDKDSRLVPGLAAEMPTRVSDTTWQFKLRRGIAFHNGEAFNADAVVHSIKRIFDPAYQSTQLGDLRGIGGAEKVDDYTVNVRTERLDPLLPSRMYWLKIVPPTASAAPNFAEAPVGTGPYRIVEWVKGSRIVLQRHDNYWRDKPTIQRATYRFISEGGTALSGLLAGEFDFVDNLQAEFVKQAPKAARRLGLEHSFSILSAVSGPTQDKRVREALNFAIDKQALAEGLFLGQAAPANGQMIGNRSFGYNPNLKPWPYDPAKAKALIKAAGAEGKAIEFVVPAGRWPKAKEMGEAIAGFWQEIGLKPDLKVVVFNQYLARLRDPKVRPDVIYASHNNALMEAERTVANFYQSRSKGAVSSSVEDATIDEWIAAAGNEPDNAKREALYHRIMQRGYDEAYFLFLLNTEDVYGLSRRMSWEPRLDNKVFLKEMSVN